MGGRRQDLNKQNDLSNDHFPVKQSNSTVKNQQCHDVETLAKNKVGASETTPSATLDITYIEASPLD